MNKTTKNICEYVSVCLLSCCFIGMYALLFSKNSYSALAYFTFSAIMHFVVLVNFVLINASLDFWKNPKFWIKSICYEIVVLLYTNIAKYYKDYALTICIISILLLVIITVAFKTNHKLYGLENEIIKNLIGRQLFLKICSFLMVSLFAISREKYIIIYSGIVLAIAIITYTAISYNTINCFAKTQYKQLLISDLFFYIVAMGTTAHLAITEPDTGSAFPIFMLFLTFYSTHILKQKVKTL